MYIYYSQNFNLTYEKLVKYRKYVDHSSRIARV